jgi:cyanate permease
MIGPALTGFMYDATKSYIGSFAIVGGFFLTIVVITVWAYSASTQAKIREKMGTI